MKYETTAKIIAAMQGSERAERIVLLGELRRLVGRAKVQHAVPWITDFCQGDRPLIVFAEHIPVQHPVVRKVRRQGIAVAALRSTRSPL